MCKTPMHEFLAALPKCEHHLHIEGTFEPELLFELAAKNNITLPADKDAAFASIESLKARYLTFANLDDFLGYYYIAMSALIDAADFEALAYAYFKKAASQNVRHAEVFFDAQVHTERGIAFETVVTGLKAAQRRAEKDLGITTELIMCLVKHLPLPSALETFNLAKDGGYFADGTLLAIGMDSSEKPFPPKMWTELYDAANAAGIRRTIHAGEEGPADYVVQSLDLLGAQRIDHGLRTFEDEALVKRVVEEKIMLTTCPLSNLMLQCIGSISEFPLRKLLDAGVRFSINSDDPAYFGGYILENYCVLQDTFGLTLQEWEGIAKGAVLGSWCGEERKQQLLAEIDAVVSQWSSKLE
ncbi:putative Adenine deaminase [Seiridium cardinale]|uniref:Adenine deaminase n=1 Tax=Seiridium cardinale TaxID=138064 RepID=A0ABR2XZI9_9PEZI